MRPNMLSWKQNMSLGPDSRLIPGVPDPVFLPTSQDGGSSCPLVGGRVRGAV